MLIHKIRALSSVLQNSLMALHLSRNLTDSGMDEYMNGTDTENGTKPEPTPTPGPIRKNWPALLIFIVIVITVAGNILVIMAVTLEKKLQTATNFFLMSLAVADMLVGLLVMPVSVLTILYEYTWPLPKQLCPMWISLDVLFSTASIMHLCAISLDRYIAIRNPIEHSRFNSRTKAIIKIAIVWTISMAVSVPIPIIGLRDESKVFVNGSCTLNEPNFVLIGSFVAFFIPLFIMVITYCLTIQVLQGQSQVFGGERRRKRSKFGCLRRERSANNISTIHNPNAIRIISPGHREGYRKGTMQAIANERRASKVLGIVFFLFLLMWCPFFVTNIMAVMCTQSCRKSTLDELLSVFVWVGYVCSGINPLVYTLFNKTYRRAFLKYLSFGWLGQTKSPPRQIPLSAANLYPREYPGTDFVPTGFTPREYCVTHEEEEDDDVPQIVPLEERSIEERSIEERPNTELVEVVIEMAPCSPQPIVEDTCTMVDEKVTTV
ncbi:5-hydroxytryptamine receptor 2C [Gracilinanus agilis]|uniref:5-hydroxytryptamine receptor 2C n=1 Tax=Gracilinanus agilis TaxID=191870 RepID=UPI001CFE6827|nr:5-hydroxytryptamine receptor 2C [Gracilinanus agilis]